nr:hypothetical protein [uncultured Albidiferax sp.]
MEFSPITMTACRPPQRSTVFLRGKTAIKFKLILGCGEGFLWRSRFNSLLVGLEGSLRLKQPMRPTSKKSVGFTPAARFERQT